MTAIAIRTASLLAFLAFFIKRTLRRFGSVVQAFQKHDAPGHLNKLAEPPIPGINSPLQKSRAKRWREYTPSRFVMWLVQNIGPNRKQRREEAKAYRYYLRHIARRQHRLEEQRAYKELRVSFILRKENPFERNFDRQASSTS